MRFGDPWHGLIKNGVIELPNATTRALSGAVPIGGDCLKVMRPGQAALDQTPTELAAGMEWRNYGLISGYNRVIFGVELNSLSWLYIAPDNSVWQVDYANGAGSLAFTRFGDFDHAAAGAVQITGVGTTNTEYNTRCLDVTATGDKAIISSEIGTIYQQASRGVPNILRGVFLIAISGTPPNASATWMVLADEVACQGVRSNTRMHNVVRPYYLADDDTVNGPPFVIQDSLTSHVWSYSVPTDVGYVDLGPTLPAGKSFVKWAIGGYYISTSWNKAIGPGGGSNDYVGTKSVLGAVIGATFAGGTVAKLVTVDMSLTDNHGTTTGNKIHRTGEMKIVVGGAVQESLPFERIATAVATERKINLGGLFIDTDPAHWAAYNGLDIVASTMHLVMAGPSPYGSAYSGYPCTRFIPTRYSNNAYGFMRVTGANWTLTGKNGWEEQNVVLTEQHYARSVLGGERKTLSWTGASGPTAGVGNELAQRVFATVQPDTNALELHSANVVFR